MLERLILSLIFHCSLQTVPPSSVETLAGTGSFTHPANQLKPSRLPDLGLPEHCCTGRPSPPFQPIFMSPLWHRNYWLQHFQSHLSCHTDAPPTALPRHTRRSICLFFFFYCHPLRFFRSLVWLPFHFLTSSGFMHERLQEAGFPGQKASILTS